MHRRGFLHVERFSLREALYDVDENHFVHYILSGHAIGNGGSNVSGSDDSEFSHDFLQCLVEKGIHCLHPKRARRCGDNIRRVRGGVFAKVLCRMAIRQKINDLALEPTVFL